MLRLSDFVTCRKDTISRVGGLYLSFGNCRKMEFRTYLLLTQILKAKFFMLFYVVTVE